MNDNQQQTTPTPEETGGRMFSQEQVNEIIRERLARQREQLADGSEYKEKYENVLRELEGIRAAQTHQQKENAYRALLVEAKISEKRILTVMRASREEIESLELDEAGKIVGADKLMGTIKTDWADFVVTTEAIGADVPMPPRNCGGDDGRLREAFKPPAI